MKRINRPVRLRYARFLLALTWLGSATPSFAEGRPAASGLAAAEQAYQDVDFKAMHDAATHTVEAGDATREETARLYVLIGISAAALGEDSEAKHAFVVALGVDPTLKLDRSLSPKVRDPYLEAQGYWGAYPERLALEARMGADGEHLTVELLDPGHLASKIVLHVRTVGTQAFDALPSNAEHAVRFPVPADARRRGFEYFASALDEHQNTLVELGSDGDPRLVRAAPEEPPPHEPLSRDTHAARQRSYLLPIALGAAGVVAAGIGVVFHLERESAAGEWNGPHCEHPGATRIAQCGDVDSRRRLDQGLAIGAYTAGGLLLAAGAVTLFVFPPPSLEPRAEPVRAAMTSCGLTGFGLSCKGRF